MYILEGEHGCLGKWLTSDTIKEKFNCGFPENWTEIVLAEGKKRLTRGTSYKFRPKMPVEQMQNYDLEPIAGKSIEVGVFCFDVKIDLFFVSISA